MSPVWRKRLPTAIARRPGSQFRIKADRAGRIRWCAAGNCTCGTRDGSGVMTCEGEVGRAPSPAAGALAGAFAGPGGPARLREPPHIRGKFGACWPSDMSLRLQVFILTWFRRAIRAALERRSGRLQRAYALSRLASLDAPTAD